MFHQENTIQKSIFILILCCLTACGLGENSKESKRSLSGAPPQPAALEAEVQSFDAPRNNFALTKLSIGYMITDMVGSEGSITVSGKKQLKFSDVTVNLQIGELANSIEPENLKSLTELYTAFFNRIPDADGLAYWIEQFKAGMSLDQIADNFYDAAIIYSSVTGYSRDMTNDEFVRTIYKNVLGRTGALAPPQADVDYWANKLNFGTRKGELIRTMLASARTFYKDKAWGFVPALLDGKFQIAKRFAISQGLNYITADESILKTKQIAEAVNPNSNANAEALLPSKDFQFDLSGPPSYKRWENVCTPEGEKAWTRAYMDDLYLWYKDIPHIQSKNYPDVETYFDALLVRPKDRFSFLWSKKESSDFMNEGVELSYGLSSIKFDDLGLRVALIKSNSPAAKAGINRGATIVSIDNAPISRPLSDAQYLTLFPKKIETHQFEILDLGANKTRSISLTSEVSPIAVVEPVTTKEISGRKIGYIAFHHHINSAEQPLINAISNLKSAGISELVLDLRYNGGGYIGIANELSSMLGGFRANGKTATRLIYNDKHPELTAQYEYPFPKLDSKRSPLPLLTLSRIFILASASTCSSSELLINSLSPIMDVVLIGDTTCGKPYGMLPTENCGKSFWSLNFSVINGIGEGGYVDGIAPRCKVPDDLNHALGEQNEKKFSAAITYMQTGICPVPPSSILSGPPTPISARIRVQNLMGLPRPK